MIDKITFVAPSYLLSKKGLEKLSQAIENLESIGYQITCAEHIKSNRKTTPQVKANDLIAAFKSDADIIWSVGGGEGMIETMKCLDFEKINNKNKLFIGFSDNTCLTYTLATHFNEPSIVGYNGKSMNKLNEGDKNDLFRMINGEKVFSSYDYWNNDENEETKPPLEFINFKEPVSGILLGGCIEILRNLYDAGLDNTIEYSNNHKDEGIIYFLDNDGRNSERLMENLKLFKDNHWFDNVKMFIVSRNYYYYNPTTREKLNNIYKDALGSLKKPIVLNVDIGHMDPLMPLFIGKKCTISKDESKIVFNYE